MLIATFELTINPSDDVAVVVVSDSPPACPFTIGCDSLSAILSEVFDGVVDDGCDSFGVVDCAEDGGDEAVVMFVRSGDVCPMLEADNGELMF